MLGDATIWHTAIPGVADSSFSDFLVTCNVLRERVSDVDSGIELLRTVVVHDASATPKLDLSATEWRRFHRRFRTRASKDSIPTSHARCNKSLQQSQNELRTKIRINIFKIVHSHDKGWCCRPWIRRGGQCRADLRTEAVGSLYAYGLPRPRHTSLSTMTIVTTDCRRNPMLNIM